MQKKVEFKVGRQRLVGDLHLPEGMTPPFPAVVLSHGYKSNRHGEKHQQISFRFPLEGLAVLRFDHRGALEGESAGKFEDTTLTGRVEDLAAAIAFLKKVPEIDPARLGLLGSSLGGTTILALPPDKGVKAIVLLSTPLALPALSIEEREKLAEKGYLEYADRTRMKQAFFDDMAGHNLREEARRITCPLLIIHGHLDEVVPRHQAFVLYQNAAAPKELRLVEGADHSFSDTDKMNEALALALAWFKKYLF